MRKPFSPFRLPRPFSIHPSGSSGSSSSSYIEITIPAGTVSSNLTDFPTFIDLSYMPDSFWSGVKVDGGDIRVSNSTETSLPVDMLEIDTTAKTGRLFFLADSIATATDTTFRLLFGNSSNNLLAATDPLGRNAVWADYHRVFLLDGTGVDRTGSGNDATLTNTTGVLVVSNLEKEVDVHQGVCWDGTHYYAVDTNAIKKYDSSWNLVDTNNDPVGDAAIAGANHCGAPEVHGGLLYIPVELYTSPTSYSAMHICRYSTTDLSFVGKWDISAQGHEASAIAYCDDDDLLYVASYANSQGDKLWKYDPADGGAYIGQLALSVTHTRKQGLTFWNGYFYYSTYDSGRERTWRLDPDGTVLNCVFESSYSGVYEGIGHRDDGLLQLIDGSPSAVYLMQPAAEVYPGFIGTAYENYAKAASVTKLTAWSMGVTGVVEALPPEASAIVSYTQDGSTTNSHRETLGLRLSPRNPGLWNSTDGWLTDSLPVALRGQYRFNATHNGTTARKFYRNGTPTTDSGVAQLPAGTGDALYIGKRDNGTSENWRGAIGFVYLRNGILTDDWIAAESLNLLSPGSFYTTAFTAADGAELLTGDAQSGTDQLLLSGDMQSGTDTLQTSVRI